MHRINVKLASTWLPKKVVDQNRVPPITRTPRRPRRHSKSSPRVASEKHTFRNRASYPCASHEELRSLWFRQLTVKFDEGLLKSLEIVMENSTSSRRGPKSISIHLASARLKFPVQAVRLHIRQFAACSVRPPSEQPRQDGRLEESVLSLSLSDVQSVRVMTPTHPDSYPPARHSGRQDV